jgi:hypothetical protein
MTCNIDVNGQLCVYHTSHRMHNCINIHVPVFSQKGNETHNVQIFECLTWRASDTLPADTSSLIDLIKQFSLDRKSELEGYVTVMSKYASFISTNAS